MKENIHPEYQFVQVTCTCGNVFPLGSVLKQSLSIDVCNKCHPFYTGKQKLVDSAGRLDAFRQRFGGSSLFE